MIQESENLSLIKQGRIEAQIGKKGGGAQLLVGAKNIGLALCIQHGQVWVLVSSPVLGQMVVDHSILQPMSNALIVQAQPGVEPLLVGQLALKLEAENPPRSLAQRGSREVFVAVATGIVARFLDPADFGVVLVAGPQAGVEVEAQVIGELVGQLEGAGAKAVFAAEGQGVVLGDQGEATQLDAQASGLLRAGATAIAVEAIAEAVFVGGGVGEGVEKGLGEVILGAEGQDATTAELPFDSGSFAAEGPKVVQ